jgi:tetratricopeptide (TPR) repeat protein
VVTLAIYSRAGGYGFVNLDDPLYITQNSHTQAGLSWENVRWAFTAMDASNWHPVTWLSHMLDVQIFGVRPGPQHWVNILLHIANAILLFLVLRSATGSHGPSALVAFLFAVHPLHVESVAWIAERKDLLSTLFWFLATAAYIAYARHPSVLRYLAILFTFAMGLMAKPMVVTLPVTLLLLDLWPLGRLRNAGDPAGGVVWWKLLIEKAPLFALSAISSLVTLHAQRAGQSLASLEALPLAPRLENALVSCARYLGATAFPVDLAVFYPGPVENWAPWQWMAACVLILSASIGALAVRKTRPYVTVGWFWFLITLLPVIGIVQVGLQAMADRYTYVPLTGIFIAAVWAAKDICDKVAVPKTWRVAASAAVLLPLALVARAQAGWWKDSITLLEHSLKVTRGNYFVEMNLGAALSEAGRDAESMEYNLAAIRHSPRNPNPYFNVGVSLTKLGRFDEAVIQYRKALEFPSPAKIQVAIHSNFAVTLIQLGKLDEALSHYDAALALIPGDVSALFSKGMLLTMVGRPSEALALFQKALALDPANAPIYCNYGMALEKLGRLEEAVAQYGKALENQDNPKVSLDANYGMGDSLVKLGRPQEALAYYDAALALAPDDLRAVVSKGRTLVLLNRQPEAFELYKRAAMSNPHIPPPPTTLPGNGQGQAAPERRPAQSGAPPGPLN